MCYFYLNSLFFPFHLFLLLNYLNFQLYPVFSFFFLCFFFLPGDRLPPPLAQSRAFKDGSGSGSGSELLSKRNERNNIEKKAKKKKRKAKKERERDASSGGTRRELKFLLLSLKNDRPFPLLLCVERLSFFLLDSLPLFYAFGRQGL